MLKLDFKGTLVQHLVLCKRPSSSMGETKETHSSDLVAHKDSFAKFVESPKFV